MVGWLGLWLGLVGSVAAHAHDTRTKELFDRIAEKAEVAEGSARVSHYSLKHFSPAHALAHVEKTLPDTEACHYVSTEGVGNVLRLLRSKGDILEGTEKTAIALKEMKREKRLKMAAARTLTSGGGDCDKYFFDFYAKDGHALTLHYDVTE